MTSLLRHVSAGWSFLRAVKETYFFMRKFCLPPSSVVTLLWGFWIHVKGFIAAFVCSCIHVTRHDPVCNEPWRNSPAAMSWCYNSSVHQDGNGGLTEHGNIFMWVYLRENFKFGTPEIIHFHNVFQRNDDWIVLVDFTIKRHQGFTPKWTLSSIGGATISLRKRWVIIRNRRRLQCIIEYTTNLHHFDGLVLSDCQLHIIKQVSNQHPFWRIIWTTFS